MRQSKVQQKRTRAEFNPDAAAHLPFTQQWLLFVCIGLAISLGGLLLYPITVGLMLASTYFYPVLAIIHTLFLAAYFITTLAGALLLSRKDKYFQHPELKKWPLTIGLSLLACLLFNLLSHEYYLLNYLYHFDLTSHNPRFIYGKSQHPLVLILSLLVHLTAFFLLTRYIGKVVSIAGRPRFGNRVIIMSNLYLGIFTLFSVAQLSVMVASLFRSHEDLLLFVGFFGALLFIAFFICLIALFVAWFKIFYIWRHFEKHQKALDHKHKKRADDLKNIKALAPDEDMTEKLAEAVVELNEKQSNQEEKDQTGNEMKQ